MEAYSLTGSVFGQWSKERTIKELRRHLIEVAFHFDSVDKCREKIAEEEEKPIRDGEEITKLKGKLNMHEDELLKETADLLILNKHYVLVVGGGVKKIEERLVKFENKGRKPLP